ncbi:hypothetical protein GQ43DRAFT_438268 [Delitschia confertaspora ATCC 74209]|uniref:Cupin type-1 domain-containing protein n=1 Tax=Delitschia confertaspora ATCC 74209 TaxID=1513339 RepID=A0A9P4MUV8_9PLEO|nr:hypothetical protein GQ43DRAFT_438268 [Delitschia confertaspora ATCC 74209]
MPLKPIPLSTLKYSTHHIPSHSLLPNTTTHPLYIYHRSFPPGTSPSAIESHLSTMGVVTPVWRYTMYRQTHYHSTSHELLCIYQGSAKLCFGGEENPKRVETVVGEGDVVVVPAGLGHRLLEDLTGDEKDGFMMVGSYPKGCSWDMCYGKEGEEEKARKAGEVKWFDRDPVYGDEGPVLGTGGEEIKGSTL